MNKPLFVNMGPGVPGFSFCVFFGGDHPLISKQGFINPGSTLFFPRNATNVESLGKKER